MDRRRHDKGIPASGLLAQVAIAKVDDQLALYRQTEIYAGSGVHIPCSSMSQWLGICGVLDLDLDQLRLSLLRISAIVDAQISLIVDAVSA